MSVRLGYPTPFCSLPSTGAKLEGELAYEFTLSLGRSLVAVVMWLYSV